MGIKMYTKCWLTYETINKTKKNLVKVFCYEKDPVIINAIDELKIGFEGLYHRDIEVIEPVNRKEQNSITTNPLPADDRAVQGIYLLKEAQIPKEGYRIIINKGVCTIEASDSNGILYGVFAMLRKLQMTDEEIEFEDCKWEEEVSPDNPLRMINHWDNMDGSIERGYSGNSFFFKDNELMIEKRTKEYARLLASVGINAVVINNVNVSDAATNLITGLYYSKLRELAELFSSFGISLYLSINYAAPIVLGDLETSDPCDERVKRWWKEKAEEVWKNIPHLGGFLIKADSEGRPGPFTYRRTHADGANMLADAVAPYGGRIIWRCFVYNCTQDWRDTVTDRARAGYDNFKPLDGLFRNNVTLQIKNGPMDFQVREPVSPLFGGLKDTNMIIEVQIAQEYTGQQRHVCYLIPWFKEILEFDMHVGNTSGKVSDLVSGRTYGQTNCGMAAVTNTGDDENWTGHDLAAANLYGFGRLSFQTSLSAEVIAREWIWLTFGRSEKIKQNILKILMMSWPAYEKYTSPLGIGWMVNPNHHYGPNVDGYEYDRWGTYHRADCKGIGVDRTESGTGYCTQYNEPLASVYKNVNTCPEELLLFFHRIPYDYTLKSGKTMIQHIYDTHFEGAEEAELFLEWMKELEELIETAAFARIIERLEHQKVHSKEWRDIINAYFYRKSGIADEKGRKIYA